VSRTFRRKNLSRAQSRPFDFVFAPSRYGGAFLQVVTLEPGSREYTAWYWRRHSDRPSGTNNAPAWLRRKRNRVIRAKQRRELMRGLHTDLEAVQVSARQRDVNWLYF
jgi:hypothetical protein